MSTTNSPNQNLALSDAQLSEDVKAKAKEDAQAGIISKVHQDWLRTHLDTFLAYCNTQNAKGAGVRKVGGVKGEKKAWVLANVWPGFVKEYKLDGKAGAPLEPLRKKIVKWYANHCKPKNIPTKSQAVTSANKPRAATAIELFGKDNVETINKCVKEIRKMTGRTTQQVNLEAYREVRDSMFSQLGEAELLEFKEKAAAENEKQKRKPDPQHIYDNQLHLSNNTMAVLRKLGGDDWGQHGSVVFFVQAAYRDQKNRWKTLTTTVTTPGMKNTDFREYLGEEVYQGTFRAPFRNFLDILFPAPDETPESGLAITFNCDRYPQLPDIDIESTPPKITRSIIKEYLDAVWVSTGYTKIFNCAEEVKYLTSIDLEDMDMGQLYRNITLCQAHGALSFALNESLTYELLNDLIEDGFDGDSDILELPDPSAIRCKGNKAGNIAVPSREKSGKINAAQQQPPLSPPQVSTNSKSPSPIDFSPDMHDADKSTSGKTASPPPGRMSPSPFRYSDDNEWQGIDSTRSPSPVPFDNSDRYGEIQTKTPSPCPTPPFVGTAATAKDPYNTAVFDVFVWGAYFEQTKCKG
ncbi:hypothetical protein EST38_g13782 [Candolleomyces aberdarensis]|uniref:Uncharacterized protein n=1 Tax=Candolleomyces aberdarensis TaxID=2316362 RepID=A0A4Q2CYY0_9AGAR|nr:hypothetical protein EST38_g13782 [Candolleomyces aberdarensis]